MVLVGCSGGPQRYRLVILVDPQLDLAEVEARWRMDMKQRGSIIRPEGRCYFRMEDSQGDFAYRDLDALMARMLRCRG